ncbi:MAG: hypothetical protein NT085_03270 [candidate division SR1 bacterium]|nr:hypothetical protein [candidate division SR1 bacterium]
MSNSKTEILMDTQKKLNVLIIDHEPHYKDRQIKPFEKIHNVELAISIAAIDNRIEMHKTKGGLNFYDLILIDPFFPCDGKKYTLSETQDGTITGWCLYKNIMQDLDHTKIVVWTYTPSHYTDLGWGDSVIFKSKCVGGDKDELFAIVEEIFSV